MGCDRLVGKALLEFLPHWAPEQYLRMIHKTCPHITSHPTKSCVVKALPTSRLSTHSKNPLFWYCQNWHADENMVKVPLLNWLSQGPQSICVHQLCNYFCCAWICSCVLAVCYTVNTCRRDWLNMPVLWSSVDTPGSTNEKPGVPWDLGSPVICSNIHLLKCSILWYVEMNID